ncbi:hypothetical protein [Alphaentomopoxvirus acuprea]|uniref:Uncharacterized protein n=1 Tax=Alphaentomopoxvirus acuprea TaxID=62099 RepID=W6JPM9_9POXV|nr:hypothetical protein BA82_gp199 [Anomala cuprea entomopoxvirus]BAO49559.1 hypothetical protein [Anomala cuprea entomopoxvirus]
MSPCIIFAIIFVIIIHVEWNFLTEDHIRCNGTIENIEYNNEFCMAKTMNLYTDSIHAYLINYGRWSPFILLQLFISVGIIKSNLLINDLQKKKATILKRYILIISSLVCIILCWTLSYISLGGYFNYYIKNVIYSPINRNVPADDFFPLSAMCMVENKNSTTKYETYCDLPLNVAVPYYFIMLFIAYIIGIIWVIKMLLKLAKEFIIENILTITYTNCKNRYTKNKYIISKDSPYKPLTIQDTSNN